MSHEAGKGSSPRPYSITHDEYANRWDMIFKHSSPPEPTPVVREDRYCVLKWSDVDEHLSTADKDNLERMLQKVLLGRGKKGKPPLKTVVVEEDWLEYNLVWKMIENRVNKN